ncbi:unnamed protein product, partial [Adineta ricciae]
TNSIGVFFGFGNGSFTTAQFYSTGLSSGSIWISIADLNNDNLLDLAVANPFGNNVGVFLGDHHGNFTNQWTYATGPDSKPYSLTIGDYNRDGRLDLATANFGSNSIAILLGHPAQDSSRNRTPILLGNYYANFQSETSYSTGSSPRPYSFAIGDLNNDTQMDIVVANSGGENLGIALGHDNGYFTSASPFPIGTGSNPGHVIINDFNGDNELDVALTDGNNNSVVVLLGNGNATFPTKLTYTLDTNSNPTALAVGYVNEDIYLDLIVANENQGTVGIFYGLKYTRFTWQTPCDAGKDSSPDGLAIGDFNNDGYLDLTVSLYYAGKIGVFLGYGNGSFSPVRTYSEILHSQPRAVTVGDVNNDQRLDIIEVKRGLNSIAIVLGYGNGSFADPVLFSSGTDSRPRSVAAGDFNQDDCLDVTVANYGTNTVGVFFGYCNGTYDPVLQLDTGKSSRPNSVTLFDVNKDSYPDIIVANRGIDQVRIFFSNGNKSFTDQLILSTGDASSPVHAIARDFDNDVKVDLAVGNYGTYTIVIFYGFHNGSFNHIRTFSTGSNLHPEQLNVGDFNNDNQLDIIVIDSNSIYMGVFFGYADGTFASISLIPVEQTAAIPGFVALGDFNNDDYLDIGLAEYGNNYVQIYLANGTKPFTGQTTSYNVGENSLPSALAVADFNNDSYLDIATANRGSNSIGVFLGYGKRLFSNVTLYSTGNDSYPASLVTGDFNNDSIIDIIVANTMSDTIVIFLGVGNGEFVLSLSYGMGENAKPVCLAVGDFNRDLKKDLAVVNYGANNVALLLGTNNGRFVNLTWYPLGYDSRPNWVAFKDLNNDGWEDIAVVTYYEGLIKVLFNHCPN